MEFGHKFRELREFAKELERELNDALRELEKYRGIAEKIGAGNAVSERDESIKKTKILKEALEEAHSLNVNIFSDSVADLSSYYPDYKRIIKIVEEALKL